MYFCIRLCKIPYGLTPDKKAGEYSFVYECMHVHELKGTTIKEKQRKLGYTCLK